MTHRDFQNSVDFGSVDYRMIRTIFSIGTIRQFVVLEVEVKLNLPNNLMEIQNNENQASFR